ncbi:MAG: M1 family metallopeptidase [Thaumarchaeota archaeon]|nr:M1 family metallopeptidase [Nitrososphaerota archaeon]
MQVNSYDLFLDLDFKSLKFDGQVVIDVDTEEDLTLNALGLNILQVRDGDKTLPFEHEEENLVIKTGGHSGRLTVEYSGTVSDTLVGIYRAPYDDTHIISTQFEAANARRMLPCLDHPGHKATFKLAVRIDKELDAISNTPVENVTVNGKKKTVSFQKTPRMSTYLLYLGVGRFEEIRDKFGSVDLVAATTLGKARKGEFALSVAKKALWFYESYFAIPYMLPKVHLIAVPEFAAGAMENWGAVTFREIALLVDSDSAVRTKKRVAEVVAHELAHQWFGNLVTMKWWDDLWLNESFATFMAYKFVDATYPEWKAWQDFLRGDTSGAMNRDSLRSTHPIEAQINQPSDIEQIFDDISYGKGASVLRMIEAYMGADSFRKGVDDYLNRYRYSNAAGRDFWEALEKASEKQISWIMDQWIRKPGYPVVTASMDEGKLILRQERFLLSGEYEKDLWPIPVTLRVNGEARRVLLDKEQKAVDVGGVDSLKLNVDQTGFYRVRYDGLYDVVWRSSLSEFDRWGLISDALAFLVSCKLSFADYFGLVNRYYGESDYLPSLEVSDQLAFLYILSSGSIKKASTEFHRSQLNRLEGKNDGNSSMLRGIMAARLVVVDDNYAENLALRFMDYGKVEPDMRDAVAVAYARSSGDFEGIVSKYRSSGSDEERLRLLSALTTFKEKELVALSLGLALSGDVKKQDVMAMILTASKNPEAKDTAWTWIKVNVSRLRRLYEGTGTLSRIFLSTLPVLGVGKVSEVEKFFEANKIPEAEKGIDAGLERLRIYDNLVRRIQAP